MKIREVKRFNLRVFNAVLKLIPQLASGVELPARKHFKGILQSQNTHLFIAELENEQVVGMLTIGSYDVPSGTKVWIEDVVVDESQRGRGIGKELMLFAISFAKSLGAGSVELTSRPSRTAANQLYKKLGFVIRDTNLYRYQLK